MGWTTPGPGRFTPRKRPGTHCTWRWVGPRVGMDGCRKSRNPTVILSPDRPARSVSLYWLSHPGPIVIGTLFLGGGGGGGGWVPTVRIWKNLACKLHVNYRVLIEKRSFLIATKKTFIGRIRKQNTLWIFPSLWAFFCPSFPRPISVSCAGKILFTPSPTNACIFHYEWRFCPLAFTTQINLI